MWKRFSAAAYRRQPQFQVAAECNSEMTCAPSSVQVDFVPDTHLSADLICIQEVLGRTNRLLSFEETRAAQKMMRPTILPLLLVYSSPQ
jgi:hypothetical protein